MAFKDGEEVKKSENYVIGPALGLVMMGLGVLETQRVSACYCELLLQRSNNRTDAAAMDCTCKRAIVGC